MRTRNSGVLILLGMLLAVTACQKIDADDFTAQGSKTDTSSTPDPSDGDTNGMGEGGEDAGAKQLVEQSDGTLLFPADNHVIALTMHVGSTADNVLLVSLYEWHDVYSTYSSTNSTQALDIVGRYKEGGMTGWRMPSKEEAKKLRDTYNSYPENSGIHLSDTLQSLNAKIAALGGRTLRAWESKDGCPAYRYLCSEADSSFSLKTGSSTTKAGTKTKYNLRLVKDSVIVK